jgi:GNAT superfamily N-acetyltransferase
MTIRPAAAGDEVQLIQRIGEFRVALSEMRGNPKKLDLDAAEAELAEYQNKGYPVYVAEDDVAGLAGYLVCRVDGNVVWAESLYVLKSHRRQGIASALYAQAEKLASELGGGAPYNWIDPENQAIIGFLRGRGYDVLNLVELRRSRDGETLTRKVRVGEDEFRR